jgi:hypothetical protein
VPEYERVFDPGEHNFAYFDLDTIDGIDGNGTILDDEFVGEGSGIWCFFDLEEALGSCGPGRCVGWHFGIGAI